MGALHEGHVSLFRAAKAASDVVIATIFVNPRQFADAEDLEHYPRTLEADRALALECGVDCLITPTLDEMWPDYPPVHADDGLGAWSSATSSKAPIAPVTSTASRVSSRSSSP